MAFCINNSPFMEKKNKQQHRYRKIFDSRNMYLDICENSDPNTQETEKVQPRIRENGARILITTTKEFSKSNMSFSS